MTRLRVLGLRENRVGDDGVRALARSPVMATLRVLDLTGNIITEESADLLHEASVEYDWRGLLQLKVDAQLKTRLMGLGPLGGYFRRMHS
jgi:Ran GTPase-activating protein (RanGAP) involved in mRNA processing and transport